MSTQTLPERTAAAIQRRTLAVLVNTQVIGGVGVLIGIAVGALLTARIGGTGLSGLGGSFQVIGAAVLAVPISRLMRARGRRPGLTLAYLIGAAGGALVVYAAARSSLALLFAGLFLFGGGSAANLQARYAAVDLAEPQRRGRQLSLVVWATTIGAIAGPNLAEAADTAMGRFGAAKYSGPFVISAIAFTLAATLIGLLLRPDPLLTARRLRGPEPEAEVRGGTGMAAALKEVAASVPARLGIASVAVGHFVMVGVMSMTPVHIGSMGGHGDVLRIVGLVISLHVAGMYAVSPITGWMTDRYGRRPVILVGVALLVGACAIAGTSGHDTPRLAVGLALLGMGWSATMVAGSTLLSESVGVANRPSVQGLSDFIMGLAGASAGALGGVVVAWSGYATLTVLAAVATVPLAALALRPVRLAVVAEGS
jgi:MFS family permease